MNIIHVALYISCLIQGSALTGKEKECSSRSETDAGGYFQLKGGNVRFDCVKRIKVSKGFRVKMFIMSSTSNFEVEVVECADRTTSSIRALNRNLETYESKQNEIEVRIDANSTRLDIQWWRVCGGSLDGNSGKLIGPEHASGYPENQTCVWNITVLNGYMLLLNLNIEGYNDSTNCSFDYIQVIESDNDETISRGPICSGMLQWKSNASMRIVFQSDYDSTTGLSFNASWESKCGDTFYADNGELASPDNPVDFNSQVQCNWIINVSPGHTIVINYTFPKTSNEEAGCKSYVQVTEADSDASKILCQSKKFAVHKSSSNLLRIVFTYDPGMSYTMFYAQWHSEDAQKPKGKVSNTEVVQAEGSNWSTKDEHGSGSTTYPIVTLQEKDSKVTKTSGSDVILQTAAAPLAILLITIIVLSLVWCSKSLRCISKGNTTYDMKENMYDSLNEIDIKVENCQQQIRGEIFNPETFRQRLPTPRTNTLFGIFGRVRKGIQFRNERYDTVHGEPKEGFHLTVLDHTELHESKQDDELPEQEMLSIRNDSTMETFPNVGYISSDNVDQAKTLSVCSTTIVKTDCIINESAIAAIDSEDYLTPIDDNLTHAVDYVTPVHDNVTCGDDNLTAVDDYLNPVDAVDDYLTPVDAVDDYLTHVDAVDDYLTPVDAVDDYLTPVDDTLTHVDDYLTPVHDN